MGLIATNTIAQGATLRAGLEVLHNEGATVYRAYNDYPWPGQAAVVVNMVHLCKGAYEGERVLDDKFVENITPALDDMAVYGTPHKLQGNAGLSFIGSFVNGIGFVLEPDEAQVLIAKEPKNKDVLFPYLNGQDLNSHPQQEPSRWVINFFDWPLERTTRGSWHRADVKQKKAWLQTGQVPTDYPHPVASDYPDCLQIVRERVKPARDKVRRKAHRLYWWHYGDKRPALYETIAPLERVLVVAQTSRTLAFSFVPKGWVYAMMTVVFAFDKYQAFALLQSNFHETWARTYASTMKQDLRYTPSNIFENFPFPEKIESLEGLGEAYHQARQVIMLNRQEGLTATYNRFHDPEETAEDIVMLRGLHKQMDERVAEAYGWASTGSATDLDLGHGFHETAQGVRYTISEPARRKVLTRLLQLNHRRYEEEVAQGLHDKKGKTKRPPTKKKKPAPKKDDGQMSLF